MTSSPHLFGPCFVPAVSTSSSSLPPLPSSFRFSRFSLPLDVPLLFVVTHRLKRTQRTPAHFFTRPFACLSSKHARIYTSHHLQPPFFPPPPAPRPPPLPPPSVSWFTPVAPLAAIALAPLLPLHHAPPSPALSPYLLLPCSLDHPPPLPLPPPAGPPWALP